MQEEDSKVAYRSRVSFIVIMFAFALLAPGSSSRAQTDSATCDDFTYQEDAQEAWNRGEGRPRPDYMTGMDEDNDGIACEHLPNNLAFYQTLWFWTGLGLIAVFAGVGYWRIRKVKATHATRDEVVLFPGRSGREEVEDELALLKADKAIDDDENVNETP